MHGISVYRVGVHFLVVVKYTVAPERTGADDVPIRQDVPKKKAKFMSMPEQHAIFLSILPLT